MRLNAIILLVLLHSCQSTVQSHHLVRRGARATFRKLPIMTQSTVSTNTPKSVTNHRSLVLGILLPWLYFICSSLNLTTLPNYVNWSLNRDAAVNARSAQVYGNMQGCDALFTFLSVNFIGCLSDIYGRKKFMMLASIGLGASYLFMLGASTPSAFYFAAILDGLTSCMLSQAQAYVADNQSADSNLSVALSRFQGLAIGMAFIVGIPMGSLLTAHDIRGPLLVSIGVCVLNVLLTLFFLSDSKHPTKHTNANAADTPAVVKRIDLVNASPLGAIKLLSSPSLRIGAVAYFAVTLAHAGMQATWVNYLAHRFGWSSSWAGATLVLIGLGMAVLPPIFM